MCNGFPGGRGGRVEKNVKLVIQTFNNARCFVGKNTQQFSVRIKNNGE